MKSIQSYKELYEQQLYWYFVNLNKSSFSKQWLNTGIGKLRRIETNPPFEIFLLFLSAKKRRSFRIYQVLKSDTKCLFILCNNAVFAVPSLCATN